MLQGTTMTSYLINNSQFLFNLCVWVCVWRVCVCVLCACLRASACVLTRMWVRLCCYVNAPDVDVLTAAYTRPILRPTRRWVLVYMNSGLAPDLRPTGRRAQHTVQRPGRFQSASGGTCWASRTRQSPQCATRSLGSYPAYSIMYDVYHYLVFIYQTWLNSALYCLMSIILVKTQA